MHRPRQDCICGYCFGRKQEGLRNSRSLQIQVMPYTLIANTGDMIGLIDVTCTFFFNSFLKYLDLWYLIISRGFWMFLDVLAVRSAKLCLLRVRWSRCRRRGHGRRSRGDLPWLSSDRGNWWHPPVISLAAGKGLHNYEKSPVFMGKSIVFMTIFNSNLFNYQRVMLLKSEILK